MAAGRHLDEQDVLRLADDAGIHLADEDMASMCGYLNGVIDSFSIFDELDLEGSLLLTADREGGDAG